MKKDTFFYQIPSNRRGVILAVVAAALAAVSVVWGTFMIWDHDPDGVTVPTPGITATPTPTTAPAPTTPAKPNPGKTTIIQTPGKTILVPVPGTPAPAPPPVIVPVPVPASPEPPACLDLRHVLAPGCRIL